MNAHGPAKMSLYSPRVFSKRTKQRFIADRTRQLLGHLNREPSFPERLVVDRVISLEWWLRRLDARIDAGDELSGHAIRGRLAAETRLKLDLMSLGLRPQPQREASLSDWLAEGRAKAGAPAA